MSTRDYEMSDDSALESDVSSSLSDDNDEDNRAVEDLMNAQEHLAEDRTVMQPVEMHPKQLSKSTRCRTRREPAAGRSVALTVDAMSARRQRKPSAKFVASATNCSRKSAALGESITRTKASRKLPPVSSLMASSPAFGGTTMSSSKKDRLLMRQWLILMANTRQIPNMYWYNEQHTQIRIPWKHGSRSCWTLEDCQLYKAWARHTGKYSESHGDEPKRWKANFRCALNSLPDVVEVKTAGQSRGGNPFKVYELLEEVNRKNTTRRVRKSRRPKVDHCEKHQLPLAAASSTVTGRCRTTSKVQKLETLPVDRQVSAQRESPAAVSVYHIPQKPTAVSSEFKQARANILESRQVTDYQLPSVIPIMVEEMTLDEARETDGNLNYFRTDVTNSSDLDREFQSDYQRSTSSSPSESSGYETDPSLIHDVEVTGDEWDASLNDVMGIAETPGDQFHQLENVDFITWLAS